MKAYLRISVRAAKKADGVCTDCLGNPLVLTSGTVAVSNGRFHDSFVGDVQYTPPV